jgi:hypothetical protein
MKCKFCKGEIVWNDWDKKFFCLNCKKEFLTQKDLEE